MLDDFGPRRAWLWLTAPLAALVALVSLAGLLRPGLYGASPAWIAQGQAQDFVDLVLVLPVLVAAALLAGRGSRRGLLVWFGAVAYLVYSFVIYAFSVRYNALFLAYVAALGCALWALAGGLATTNWRDIGRHFAARAPVRPVSIFLLVLVVLFYLLWLREDVAAALAGVVPQSIQDAGLLTNPVHVLDMAVLLPAMALAAIWLWRKQPLGYGLAGVMLVIAIFEALGIAGVMVFSARAGLPAGPVPVFAGLAGLSLALLAWYLAGLRPGAAA